ncbi:MAG TPA: hypothetical protein VN366_06590 [Feifaniaceae bacterium]|nr:hypothetical protein [Feifaniaceae bacterium]
MPARIWVYLAWLVILLLTIPFYKKYRVRTMRLLGCSVIGLWVCVFSLAVLLGEFVLPAPQYYISARDARYGGSLNEILEREARNSGIAYEEGSFRILESGSMHLNHLFLCSYRVAGRDELRIFRLEKNIFGNMKPAEPFAETVPQDGNPDHFYRDIVEDGFFGTYLVTAGYAPEGTVWNGRVADAFYFDAIHLQGHFLVMELANEKWKLDVLQFAILFLIALIPRVFNKKYEPERFYTGWKKGEKLFQMQCEDKAQAK